MTDDKRARTVTWEDPIPGARAARDLHGMDYLQALLGGDYPAPPNGLPGSINRPTATAPLFGEKMGRLWARAGFRFWNLNRIVAMTTYDNEASMAVMRRAGMRIERNLEPDPEWFQIVGVIDHPT